MTPRPTWERLLRQNVWVAATLVTVLTIALVGGVIVTTTTLACGPTNKLGIKMSRCISASKTASLNSPPPLVLPSPPPSKGGSQPPVASPATFYPPESTPATFYPPAVPPGSSGVPPQDPFYPAASQNGGFGLSCTLPAFAGPPGSGGFFTFPGGAFTPDPRSAVALPSPGPAPGSPYGPGPNSMSYDRVHSRWLPVSAQFVAPDGNHYAFASTSGIYVVDTTGGTVSEIGEGRTWQLLRVLNDRAYATVTNTAGLWIVQFSGAASQVTSQGYWAAANAGAAYGTATSAVPAGTTQELLRLDIGTGKTSHWFSETGATVSVLGFDAHDSPIVQANYVSNWEIWVVASATSARIMANSNEQFWIQGPMLADNHGVWMPIYSQQSQTNGLALYVQGSGIYVMTTVQAQVAGGCA